MVFDGNNNFALQQITPVSPGVTQASILIQPAIHSADGQSSAHGWAESTDALHFPGGAVDMELRPDIPPFVATPQAAMSQLPFDPGLIDSSFQTEDANLLEFFRYGLAQWPDSTNIWPPINDFGNSGP
ncbi:hypothetical protein QFC19_008615 [Naganishia cerealis]|uniref:Uncharacterized protein n=1 Tax=Naganishia cerealis TaxID=610337 RepID=A0ACC2V1F0_9TREE|nr:hypothetical protein QFC19_008615 [Naganishia cerealis]